MAHQNNATMLWIRRRNLSVLEFFAVGKTFRALFWCAVKGGVRCRKLTYLQFSRFPWSHFFLLHFFIGYFTLPYNKFFHSDTALFIHLYLSRIQFAAAYNVNSNCSLFHQISVCIHFFRIYYIRLFYLLQYRFFYSVFSCFY